MLSVAALTGQANDLRARLEPPEWAVIGHVQTLALTPLARLIPSSFDKTLEADPGLTAGSGVSNVRADPLDPGGGVVGEQDNV